MVLLTHKKQNKNPLSPSSPLLGDDIKKPKPRIGFGDFDQDSKIDPTSGIVFLVGC